ncbi:hypothetical protein, partial [Hyphomicrobium sp. 2TAF46]|uniref:hypothetical protein n=1 Tax=Hyphomicrobium sp. 2TAF46 TaxID=3233019 RepID=UPI003F90CAD5
MVMYVLFGVKDSGFSDVDDAAAMAAHVINATPIKRSGDGKGDYCTFETGTAEEVQLVSGTFADEDGKYPASHDFPNWKFLLYLNETSAQSTWLKAR